VEYDWISMQGLPALNRIQSNKPLYLSIGRPRTVSTRIVILPEKTRHFFVPLSEVVVAASKISPAWSRNNSRLSGKLTQQWTQNGALRQPAAVA